MWFKQISFHPLNKGKPPELEILADKLGESEFVHCQGLEWFSEGFAASVPFSPGLVFPTDYTWRVALKKEEKVLPAGVIRDILGDKALEIQNNDARNVGRKEKQELKEQTTDDLLLRTFTHSSRTQAIFDTRRGLLLVNNAASAKAENVLTKLREALDGLEASLPNTKQSPSGPMTSWLLNGHCEGGFELDSDCELKNVGDVVLVVKVSKQDLTADEVVQHVKNGKTVTQLGLVWREQIVFVLTQDFTLKRIQCLDILQEEAKTHGDDAASMTFASQILMTKTVSTTLEELVSYLGGWQD